MTANELVAKNTLWTAAIAFLSEIQEPPRLKSGKSDSLTDTGPVARGELASLQLLGSGKPPARRGRAKKLKSKIRRRGIRTRQFS
jgi:hypothetical protein